MVALHLWNMYNKPTYIFLIRSDRYFLYFPILYNPIVNFGSCSISLQKPEFLVYIRSRQHKNEKPLEKLMYLILSDDMAVPHTQ